MARPRPIAVVRLRAKTDTSVNSLTTSSTRNVPTTDRAPMASGSDGGHDASRTRAAAGSSVIGMAIISARTQVGLDRLVHLGEHRAEAADPHGDRRRRVVAGVVLGPLARRRRRGRCRRRGSGRATRARSPSSLASGLPGGSDQYDSTSVIARPSNDSAAELVGQGPAGLGDGRVVDVAVARPRPGGARSGVPVPNSSARTSSTTVDSASGSSKPPEDSRSATPPPTAPETTKATSGERAGRGGGGGR